MSYRIIKRPKEPRNWDLNLDWFDVVDFTIKFVFPILGIILSVWVLSNGCQ